MIEGIIIMIIGALIICAVPAERYIAWHRHHRSDPAIAMALREAIPIPSPNLELDRLVVAADAALDRDALTRGVRGVGEIYDRA